MKLIFSLCLAFLALTSLSAHAELIHAPLYGAHLQGKIKISLTVPNKEQFDEIQPGSMIKLSATIRNTGDKASASGKIFVRFAFQKPLNSHVRSTLFETEKKHLPSIAPGKELIVYFEKAHQWPALFDYIRDDWNMRQYEVITDINNKLEVIGRAAISVSAHYYEGPAYEIPVEVDPLEDNLEN